MKTSPTTLVALLSLGYSNARAEEPMEIVTTLRDAARVEDAEGARWRVEVQLESVRPLLAETIYAHTTVPGAERVTPVVDDDGVAAVELPAGGDALAVRFWGRVDEQTLTEISGEVDFLVDGDRELVLVDEQTYLARAEENSERLIPEYEPTSTVGPEDNPSLSDEQRRVFADKAAAQAGGLEVRSSALTAGSAGAAAGCEGGGAATWVGALFFLVLVCARRRFAHGLAGAIVVLLAVQSGAAQARHIYGYLAFWDARTNMKTGTGSRLPACVDSNTTCGPADNNPNCCSRALPYVGAFLLTTSGVVVAYDEVDGNGAFGFSFTPGIETSYLLKVVYDRDFGPATMRMTADATAVGTAAPALYRAFKISVHPDPVGNPLDEYYYARVMMNPVHDTMGTNATTDYGGQASAWTSITQAQEAIAAEGDTRYRRNFGEPATDPDDYITVRFTNTKWAYYDCSLSDFNVYYKASRTLMPAFQMGVTYLGRVVGCARDGSGNPVIHTDSRPIGVQAYFNSPAFPPNPGLFEVRFPPNSEGLVGALVVPEVVTMLSRWDPQTANIVNVRVGTGDCFVDTFDNTNDAAAVHNAALALWELIDTDDILPDVGYDVCDISLKQVMDALVWARDNANPATANHGRLEQSFVNVSFCGSAPPGQGPNEGCALGQICDDVNLQGTACYGGDPHASNIYDIAWWVDAFAAVDGWVWPDACDFLGTLESETCLGPPDNGPDYVGDPNPIFTGGYRTD